MQKAEQFLKTARLGGGFAGGSFDFISVCPPYLLVDYNELYDLLEASPLVRSNLEPLAMYSPELKPSTLTLVVCPSATGGGDACQSHSLTLTYSMTSIPATC